MNEVLKEVKYNVLIFFLKTSFFISVNYTSLICSHMRNVFPLKAKNYNYVNYIPYAFYIVVYINGCNYE